MQRLELLQFYLPNVPMLRESNGSCPSFPVFSLSLELGASEWQVQCWFLSKLKEVTDRERERERVNLSLCLIIRFPFYAFVWKRKTIYRVANKNVIFDIFVFFKLYNIFFLKSFINILSHLLVFTITIVIVNMCCVFVFCRRGRERVIKGPQHW